MKSTFSKQERRALNLLFWPFGIGAMATATRFPEIRDQLNINNGTFGTYLSLGAIGGVISFILVGHLVHSVGVKPIVVFAATGLFVSLGLVPHIQSPILWLVINILIAFFWVSFHIANNAQAIHRQEEVGELILPKLHGLWSLGALITSILAIVITPYVTLAWHIDVLVTIMWALTMYGVVKSTPYFIKKNEEADAFPNLSPIGIAKTFKFQPVIVIAMVLAMQVEFSIQDWSAIYAKDTIKMSASSSIYGYAVFISAMIILRFNAKKLAARWSERELITKLPIIGGVGFAVCISLGTWISQSNRILGFIVALVGFALAGFGSSILAPTIFAISFRKTSLPSSVVVAQIGLTQTISTFLAKVVIAWVAQATSVTIALMIPALMLLATSKFSHLGKETKD
ncbi:MAG: MFS transporter [Actinobacteria bacterium]|nr:MFS transporter [Actinomycetota bacterium]